MEEDKKSDSNIKRGANSYLQYTGLAFQMAGIIIFSIFIGKKLDTYFDMPKPYFTGFLTVFTLTGFMYKLYIDLIKKK
ncbi:MAG: AtpZ/AtpI family protein [Saprospiraceae bacterium]